MSQSRDQATPTAMCVHKQQQQHAQPVQELQHRGGSTWKKKRNTQPKSAKEEEEKQKGRKFFQQLQPIFSVATPAAKPRLEFLDHSDPGKDLMVRKKAREWVHRNKERAAVHTQGELSWVFENEAGEQRGTQAGKKELLQRRNRQMRDTLLRADPLWSAGASRFDPFNQLPKVGRNVDHIIEYFLTSCPEEVPCSDDKFAFKPQKFLIEPKRENTVLANMAGEHVSYVLWLHATTIVRDGILGRPAEVESMWFYKQSLKVMREALKRDVSEYTDCFLNAFACFTATSNFSGMFDAATMHCNAMVKAITLRGGGDITKGTLSCSSWTKKALQWCEFMVCAQLPQAPKIPYLPPRKAKNLPQIVIAEADRLTFITLANIPTVSTTFFNIIRWLHQLALAQGKPPATATNNDVNEALSSSSSPSSSTTTTSAWPPRRTLDACVIRPLYDAEYALLQALAAQKAPDRGAFSDAEILLAESCQLYFWMFPRGLPPEMAMCALFIARIKKAIIAVLGAASVRRVYPPINTEDEEEEEGQPERIAESIPRSKRAMGKTSTTTATISTSSKPQNEIPLSSTTSSICPPDPENTLIPDDTQHQPQQQTQNLNNLLLWSLILGTLVSRIHARPEHVWFHKQLRLQLQVMQQAEDQWAEGSWLHGRKRKDILNSVWMLFPHTDAVGWRDFRHLDLDLEHEE